MALMISPFTRFIRASRFRHFSGERLLRAIRSITHFITKIPTFLKHVLLALASDRSVFCILIHMYTYIHTFYAIFLCNDKLQPTIVLCIRKFPSYSLLEIIPIYVTIRQKNISVIVRSFQVIRSKEEQLIRLCVHFNQVQIPACIQDYCHK